MFWHLHLIQINLHKQFILLLPIRLEGVYAKRSHRQTVVLLPCADS